MGTGNLGEAAQWYAIHTKPKQEERADSNLRAWKVETFLPKIRERRFISLSGKPTYVVRPLFSRYMFARFNAGELLHKVCFTRGVQSVVCFGGRPVPIDDEIIALVQSRRGEDGFIKTGEELLPGDKVVINSGHLKDFVGVFEGEMNDHDRVAILLTTISYQARILIDKNWLGKVS